MRYNNLTRTAILGTSAALCLAVAGPAFAHSASAASQAGSKTVATKPATPTLAQQKAWIDAFVARRQQAITAYAAKVAADPKLTAAQKADLAAKLAQRQAALNTLKAAVDSATTTDALHQAIRTAMAGDGVHGYFGWCGFYGAHRHDPGTARTRTAHDPKAKPSPARVVPTASVRTVAVRSGQSGIEAGSLAHTARHSDRRGASSNGDYQARHGGSDSRGAGHAGHYYGSHHH